MIPCLLNPPPPKIPAFKQTLKFLPQSHPIHEMNLSTALILVLSILASVSECSIRSSDAAWTNLDRGTCNGVIGECVVGEEEGMMGSEVARRVLAQATRYISYGALQRDRVPCSRRGRSYYNCAGSEKANPYSRGCGVITKCARYTG